jgi:hypothetical protein
MGNAGGTSLSLRERLSGRFWVELGLGLASTLFAVLTLAWKDWVEIVFKVDPDHHSGSLEWTIVAVAVAVTVIALAAARVECRKAATAAAVASA